MFGTRQYTLANEITIHQDHLKDLKIKPPRSFQYSVILLIISVIHHHVINNACCFVFGIQMLWFFNIHNLELCHIYCVHHQCFCSSGNSTNKFDQSICYLYLGVIEYFHFYNVFMLEGECLAIYTMLRGVIKDLKGV